MERPKKKIKKQSGRSRILEERLRKVAHLPACRRFLNVPGMSFLVSDEDVLRNYMKGKVDISSNMLDRLTFHQLCRLLQRVYARWEVYAAKKKQPMPFERYMLRYGTEELARYLNELADALLFFEDDDEEEFSEGF